MDRNLNRYIVLFLNKFKYKLSNNKPCYAYDLQQYYFRLITNYSFSCSLIKIELGERSFYSCKICFYSFKSALKKHINVKVLIGPQKSGVATGIKTTLGKILHNCDWSLRLAT